MRTYLELNGALTRQGSVSNTIAVKTIEKINTEQTKPNAEKFYQNREETTRDKRNAEDVSTVQRRSGTTTEHKIEPTNSCDSCAKEITIEEFDKHNGLCRDCYYRKITGDIMRNMRQGGLLGRIEIGRWSRTLLQQATKKQRLK